jgi:hypothetical protein
LSSDPSFSERVLAVRNLRSPRYVIAEAALAVAPHYWRVTAVDSPHGKRATSRVYTVGEIPGEKDDVPVAGPVCLRAYPNPSPGSVVMRLTGSCQESAVCFIYDVSGRFIRTLDMEPVDGGLVASWDGMGARGEVLPSGIYYARVKVSGQSFHKKIVLIN